MSDEFDPDVFTWDGKQVRTLGDLVDALYGLKSKAEGLRFMRSYMSFTPHAYQNVGYVAGYMSRGDQKRVYEFTDTAHPVFGRSEPTPEEAFNAGKAMMTAVLADKEEKAKRPPLSSLPVSPEYRALIELSMYVAPEDWDSVQSMLPPSLRTTHDEAISWILEGANSER